VAEQIKSQISDGSIREGAKLPTVRELAKRLSVSPLTIHKAYADLQGEGLVSCGVGKGTFVTGGMTAQGVADQMGSMKGPEGVLTDLQQIGAAPGLRCLAIAAPDPKLFSTAEFWDACWKMRRESPNLFFYSSSAGDLRLRSELSRLLAGRLIECHTEDIVVTAGALNALTLLTQVLVPPGSCVAVEEPAYVGMLSVLQSLGVEAVPVRMDEDGVDIEALEKVIVERNPSFFFTIPNYHNPTGAVMSEYRRHEVLELAARYDLTIVEDDVAGVIGYEGTPPLSLKALDTTDRVVYVDGFSKSLLPGLRIGYVVAPAAILERLHSMLRGTQICGSPMVQRALAQMLEDGAYRAHVKRVLPKYRNRRDAMLRALQAKMPDGVTWTRPAGGFTLWVTVPGSIDVVELHHAALLRNVAFTPGQAFSVDHRPSHSLRLAFSFLKPEGLEAAVGVLADLIKVRLARA
jgi:DNA-binding transcriptional MocR family regulator